MRKVCRLDIGTKIISVSENGNIDCFYTKRVKIIWLSDFQFCPRYLCDTDKYASFTCLQAQRAENGLCGIVSSRTFPEVEKRSLCLFDSDDIRFATN